MGGLVAGHPHRVAGAAGRCRVGRIAQQVQRPGGVLFRVQQDAHTEGGIQLLPAGAAILLRQALVVVGALLLALSQMLQQGVHAVSAGLFLPVPAQQLPADVVAGRFYLERGLQSFVRHNYLSLLNLSVTPTACHCPGCEAD